MRVVLALLVGIITIVAFGRPSLARQGEVSAEPAPAAALRLLRRLRRQLASEARGPARVAIAAEVLRVARDADDLGLVVRELKRAAPSTSAANFKAVLRAIGAAVPDAGGRFPAIEVSARRPDWLRSLLQRPALGPDRSNLRSAATEAAYLIAIARGLAARRRSAAAEALLIFAYRHAGAFRDECGALLRAMGDAAVPALVRAGQLRHPLAYRMARYADYQLDRLNRLRPDLALQVDAPRLRAELLRAYGVVRHPAAVGEVLRATAATHPAVRRAARWAVLRYLGTAAAAAAPARRHLRLPGGQTSADERDLYLDPGELMLRAVAARSAALDPSGARRPSADPQQRAQALFAAQDRRRRRWRETRQRRAARALAAGRPLVAEAELDRLVAGDGPAESATDQQAIGRLRAAVAWALLAGGKPAAAVAASTLAFHSLPRDDAAGRAELAALRLAAEAGRDGPFGALSAWRWNQALERAPAAARLRLSAIRPTALRRLGVLFALIAGAVPLLLLAARSLRRAARPSAWRATRSAVSVVRG
ncbi:MAG: hypothetical protein IPL40_05110 [Proteobacteria bacterium]|nr:hypothetical protein [Pseudomonadota bacterium]